MKQESNLRHQGFYFLRNQRGQSVVELVLVMIVTVSLLLLAKPLFTGTTQFMNKYMGDYIACLMEYGELPTLGVQESKLKNHQGGAGGGKVCDSKFNGFTIANGATVRSGGSTTPGDRRNSSDNAGKDGNAANKGNQGNKSSSTSSSSANSSAASRRSGSQGRTDSSLVGSSFATADGASANSSKVRVIEDEGLEGSRRNLNAYSSASSSYSQRASRAITGKMETDIEKSIKKSSRTPTSKMLDATEEGYRVRLYKKTFTPPEIKTQIQAEKDEALSFGYLIKWLLIAGMVIAIVILLGGQILNYSNSKDQ